MGGKGKKKDDVEAEELVDDQCDEDSEIEEDEIDIEEEVLQKIKVMPSLKEKVQAIALNGHLIEKRRLDKELEKEIEIISRKYRESFKPHTDDISAIVDGTHTFTDIDFEDIGDLLTVQELETKHNYLNNQKIVEFWLKCLQNSEVIGEQIEERDEPLLKHLVKIEAGKSEDLNKTWIIFYFSENQWFTNTQLKKQFQTEGDVIKKSSGDQINWKEGKNITIKIIKKKNKKKGGEKKTKQVKEKSFFNFFLDVQIDSEDEQKQFDEDDDDDVEELQLQYEIAQALYQDIIPKSLEYYLGVIETIDDYEGLEDIEEEDQEQEQVPKKKSKSKSKNI